MGCLELSSEQGEANSKSYEVIDITKFIFAILVIGIHTEPFSSNIWLDRGFGIVTRLCVPFFFTMSAFFLFKKSGGGVQDLEYIKKYIKKIATMYFVWTIIYIPFSINDFGHQRLAANLYILMWKGNGYGLWYLLGTVQATLFVAILYRVFGGSCSKVFLVAFALFIVGLFSSTWNPLVSSNSLLGEILQEIETVFGSRSGIFYGSVYVSLGLWMSKRKVLSRRVSIFGFFVSMVLLTIESIVFVVFLKTETTVLWLSVIPATMFLVSSLLQCEMKASYEVCRMFRKMSTIMYLSHNLFIILLSNLFVGFWLFVVTVISTITFSRFLIMLSKRIPALNILY